MNPVPITSLYAGLLGLILVALTLRVVNGRRLHEVSLGDGGHADLLVAQRAHGNFVEFVPFIVVLLACLELGGHSHTLIHVLGAALVAARVAHPLGLSPTFGIRPARAVGFLVTLLVLVISSLTLLWSSL